MHTTHAHTNTYENTHAHVHEQILTNTHKRMHAYTQTKHAQSLCQTVRDLISHVKKVGPPFCSGVELVARVHGPLVRAVHTWLLTPPPLPMALS